MHAAKHQVLLQVCNEIAQAKELTEHSNTSATFRDMENGSFQFVYDPGTQTLARIDGNGTNVYLRNCDSFQFRAYEPKMTSNRFEADYIPVFATNARVIEVTWHCAERITGTTLGIEDGQSVRITIRNQWLRRL
jgi:hypothetical protein